MKRENIFYMLSLAAGLILAACGGGGGGSSVIDATPAPETTVRVSVSSDSVQGDLGSAGPSVSSNGRFIAFASDASNLLGSGVDTNGRQDIFVHDRDNDGDGIYDESGSIATVRVSVTSGSAQVTDGTNSAPSISSSGRYVAFESTSTNLLGVVDTNGVRDIFVHDRDNDADNIYDEAGAIATVRVSVTSGGVQVTGGTNSAPSISSGGRYVAFQSTSNSLLGPAVDINGASDIFVHDRDKDVDGVFDEAGAVETIRISVSSDGVAGNDDSTEPSISSDGRHIVFTSDATNLLGVVDTNGVRDIFVHDRDNDADNIYDEAGAIATVRVSVTSGGVQVTDGTNSAPSISSSGRYVAFQSTSTSLVLGDINGVSDIFVHDRDNDIDGVFDEAGAVETVRVSVSSGGLQSILSSSNPSISSTGRYIAFESLDATLTDNDTNGVRDIFIHDRDDDADGVFDEPAGISTARASVSTGGAQGSLASSSPGISADGKYVAFESSAATLVSGDSNTVADIFVCEP